MKKVCETPKREATSETISPNSFKFLNVTRLKLLLLLNSSYHYLYPSKHCHRIIFIGMTIDATILVIYNYLVVFTQELCQ